MSIHVTPITPYGLKWTLLHGGVTCFYPLRVKFRFNEAALQLQKVLLSPQRNINGELNY